MRLRLFKYELPKNLIAQYPKKKRSDARLMVVHRYSGEIEHKRFDDIVDYVSEKDVVVANDSYMFNNLLYCTKDYSLSPEEEEEEKDNSKIIVYLLREIDKENLIWNVEADPARKVRFGNRLYFKDIETEGEIIDNTLVRGRMMRFITNKSRDELYSLIIEKGLTKLPGYIKRKPNDDDAIYTRSIFAKNPGSMTHVSAGLHFDEKVVLKLQIKGVAIETLNYIINDFPVNKFDTKTINDGKRMPEFCNISMDTIERINDRIKKGGKILAVGYSSLMGLENAYNIATGELCSVDEVVSKTIVSRGEFKICNAYLTNFQEPGSMFLITDSAFCGDDLLLKAYQEAIKHEYEFLLYGDSLLIV